MLCWFEPPLYGATTRWFYCSSHFLDTIVRDSVLSISSTVWLWLSSCRLTHIISLQKNSLASSSSQTAIYSCMNARDIFLSPLSATFMIFSVKSSNRIARDKCLGRFQEERLNIFLRTFFYLAWYKSSSVEFLSMLKTSRNTLNALKERFSGLPCRTSFGSSELHMPKMEIADKFCQSFGSKLTFSVLDTHVFGRIFCYLCLRARL